jgi:ribonuclease HII
MKNFDNAFLSERVNYIAGVDEAGRGPLAGPVVAAAVVFPPEVEIEGINDSKKIPEKERERLYELIFKHALSVGVSVISHRVIDEINVLQATLRAMKSAVNKLTINPDLILIDGNKSYSKSSGIITIVKGDSKSFAIAAASIIAKVTRDGIMRKLSRQYPCYLWEKNKGYATRQHIQAIKVQGISPLHRKTFLRKIVSEKYPPILEYDLQTH